MGRRRSTGYRVAVVACCALCLNGCESRNHLSHLQTWVAHGVIATSAHPPHITPIPSIPAYHPVPFVGGAQTSSAMTTSAKNLAAPRDPFRSFIVPTPKATAIAGMRPGNADAPPLQRYALASLTLAGVVKHSGGRSWMAVLVTPKGAVHRAAIGATVGLRGGKLTKIHYAPLGASFALFRVPVAMIAGKPVMRTVKILQR
ncbi:MAG: pilus assembly protein PilP [Acidithiobacillus sp.]|nr:pilus assembly protein PilP [Acidithiobacillus sp.]